MEAANTITTTSSEMEQVSQTPRILVVDDDRTIRTLVAGKIEDLGYEVEEEVNGVKTLEFLRDTENTVDVIFLDREMPEMNGLEVVKQMKEDKRLRKIPVIMVTGSGKPEQIREGLDAGVFYYLTKPFEKEVLASVLQSALREVAQQKTLSAELQKHKTGFNLIKTCTFCFQSLAEAEHLAAFLAHCFPDPERVLSGLAELLINAVEHGNLAITYDEKTELIDKGTWREEIDRRATLSEYKGRVVLADFKRAEEETSIRITDEGAGFEWQRYLEIDPARAMDNHGRGIAQALAVSFDDIAFNEAGNEVTAIFRNEEELEW